MKRLLHTSLGLLLLMGSAFLGSSHISWFGSV
jgi:hypothetical protein